MTSKSRPWESSTNSDSREGRLSRKRSFSRHALWIFASCGSSAAFAQESSEQLAKELANPIASLISVPFQSNYDCCFGPLHGGEYTLNIQPVIPISLNPDWNLILRTIVPVIGTGDTYPQILLPDVGGEPTYHPGIGGTWGLGDTVQSFFLSPKVPTSNGIIWRRPRIPLPDRHERHSRRASLGSWTNCGGVKTARGVDCWGAGQPHLVVCGYEQRRS